MNIIFTKTVLAAVFKEFTVFVFLLKEQISWEPHQEKLNALSKL